MIYKSEEGARTVRERYQAFLKRWPVPNQQLRVPTREGETFVVACGNEAAPPLLLFHGSAGNAAMWLGDVAAWSEHFRVYAVDMIGEPGLSAPSRPPLVSDAYALWLDDVMQGLSLTRASMVGVSLGGWLALDYATRRPERVETLALLCPGGVGGQLAWETASDVLGAPPVTLHPALKPFFDFVALINENFLYRQETLPLFSDKALQRLTMPLLVIVGGKDALLDSAETKLRLARNVAHADVRYLPEAGHLLPRQTAPILEFLKRTVYQIQGTS